MKTIPNQIAVLAAFIFVAISFHPAIAENNQFEELDKVTECYKKCVVSCYERKNPDSNIDDTPRLEVRRSCENICSRQCYGQDIDPIITPPLRPTSGAYLSTPQADKPWLTKCLSHCSEKPSHVRPFCRKLCQELQ